MGIDWKCRIVAFICGCSHFIQLYHHFLSVCWRVKCCCWGHILLQVSWINRRYKAGCFSGCQWIKTLKILMAESKAGELWVHTPLCLHGLWLPGILSSAVDCRLYLYIKCGKIIIFHQSVSLTLLCFLYNTWENAISQLRGGISGKATLDLLEQRGFLSLNRSSHRQDRRGLSVPELEFLCKRH